MKSGTYSFTNLSLFASEGGRTDAACKQDSPAYVNDPQISEKVKLSS